MERDDSHSALNPMSMEVIRIVHNENLLARSHLRCLRLRDCGLTQSVDHVASPEE